MKKKLFIVLGVLVVSTSLLLSFVFKKDNKVITKEEIIKTSELPNGIMAYTLNGEKTSLSYNELLNNNTVNKITCKNGTIATYNEEDNSVSLSNIKMPDYCTLDFNHSLYSKLLADNPKVETRTDFSTTFTTTNTGTLYKSTESIVGSPAKDVYYFSGDAKNNWVKFGGFYWRIIRTNHDGSVRMLYSGTSPDTTEGHIGTSAFNSSYNDAMYVGYMYGTSETQATNRTNENNSTIKRYIDTWYDRYLSSYSTYISTEAVYCNDREVGSGTYSATGSGFDYAAFTRLATNKTPTYDCANIKDAFSGTNNEAKLTYPISLMTADEIVYAGGVYNTSLKSPYAWYYLNSAGSSITGSTWWWLLSPVYWDGDGAYSWYVYGSDDYGSLNNGDFVSNSYAVRPVISLKGNLIWTSGDGSSESPYEVELPKLTLREALLVDNPTISTRTDFSTTFTTTNTGTLYKTTESIAGSEAKDVYYFAGRAQNNWVVFADFYWRIIRTNHDGSIRLLYSGTSRSTDEGYIGTSAFNTEYNSPKYVGYMYGNSDTTLGEARTNTNNSTIKTYIDNWYSNNLSSYTKYISTEAVYCNDRKAPNYSTSSLFYYYVIKRLNADNPTYNCEDTKDAFSGSNSEAKLTYPIGLMTADEITYAGGRYRTKLSSPYAWYYSNCTEDSITGSTPWWLLSPSDSDVRLWAVEGSDVPGYLHYGPGRTVGIGVRPVISLKSDLIWKRGDGSPDSPYGIVYN